MLRSKAVEIVRGYVQRMTGIVLLLAFDVKSQIYGRLMPVATERLQNTAIRATETAIQISMYDM